MKKSLIIMELSQLIIQTMVDTLSTTLFANVSLVGTLIKWSGTGLAIEGDHPFTIMAKSCSCGGLPDHVGELGILGLFLAISLVVWSSRGVVIQGLSTIPGIGSFLCFSLTFHVFDFGSCAGCFVDVHTAVFELGW